MFNLVKCEDESVIGTFETRVKMLDFLVLKGHIPASMRNGTNRKFTKILNLDAPLKTFKSDVGIKMTIEDASASRDISNESVLVNNIRTYYNKHIEFLLSNDSDDVEYMAEWLFANTNLNKTYSKIMATNCKNTVDNIDGILSFENIREHYDMRFELWFGKASLYSVHKRKNKLHFSLAKMFKGQTVKDKFVVDEKYVPENFTGFKLYYSEDHAVVEFESQVNKYPSESCVIADVSHKQIENTAIIVNMIDMQALEIAQLRKEIGQLKKMESMDE